MKKRSSAGRIAGRLSSADGPSLERTRTDLSAWPSPPTWREDGRRGVAAFKSMPCGKCLYSILKQQVTRTFHSFVGTAVKFHNGSKNGNRNSSFRHNCGHRSTAHAARNILSAFSATPSTTPRTPTSAPAGTRCERWRGTTPARDPRRRGSAPIGRERPVNPPP